MRSAKRSPSTSFEGRSTTVTGFRVFGSARKEVTRRPPRFPISPCVMRTSSPAGTICATHGTMPVLNTKIAQKKSTAAACWPVARVETVVSLDKTSAPSVAEPRLKRVGKPIVQQKHGDQSKPGDRDPPIGIENIISL